MDFKIIENNKWDSLTTKKIALIISIILYMKVYVWFHEYAESDQIRVHHPHLPGREKEADLQQKKNTFKIHPKCDIFYGGGVTFRVCLIHRKTRTYIVNVLWKGHLNVVMN